MDSNMISDYVLEETIGSGSFGKVKRAYHVPTGCYVAIKIINKAKLIKKPDLEKKIRREIKNLKKFRHPHIIKLYEVIETNDDIYLIMELVNGGELFDYIIKSGKLSENEGRMFFQQIISAIGYCHRHKVAHRDLKPENLLLTESRKSLKIADFGLSNNMLDGELLQTSCGSPNYAAPEVIDGRYYSGDEIDIWSSGVILYALLTARLPFDDDYIPHLFNKIKRGKFKMPPYLSRSCQDLIRKMLITDPLRRITTQEIRNHPWFVEGLDPKLATFLDGDADELDDKLDEDILEKLELMYSMERKELVAYIQQDKDNVTNKYQMSYLLLYDRERENEFKFENEMKNDNIAASLAELSTSPPLNLRDEIPFLYSQSQINVLDAMKAQKLSSDRYHLEEVEDQKKVWYLGILSKHEPADIMDEVFRVLKKMKFEWKIIQPYQVQARTVQPEELGGNNFDDYLFGDDSIDKYNSQRFIFSIQLFKVNSKNNISQMHLIDIKNVEGHPMIFFDHCSKLMQQLKV